MKYDCFKDKVILITGSTSGFGEATATLFAENGAIVILNYANNDERAFEVKKKIEKIGEVGGLIKADIGREEDIKQMFEIIGEKYGKLDYLVNNAAADIEGEFETYSLDNFKRVIDVNLIGRFLCIQKAIPLMKKSISPRIINIASRFAEKPIMNEVPLGISEAGTVMLTKQAALELSKFNIRVNTVSPALAKTALTKAFMTDEDFEAYAQRNPSGRVCETTDVANTIAFLLSDAGEYINGENVNVNGGILLL